MILDDSARGDSASIAVFHVREYEIDTWFSVPGPIEDVYAAASLREYLRKKPSEPPALFCGYFIERQEITQKDYERYTANLLGKGDQVAQVYDLDLDNGAFSVLHNDGWKNYTIEAVCWASYQAGRGSCIAPTVLTQQFQHDIAGKEIERNLDIYICGDRRLEPSEISFSDEVMEESGALNFYMDVNFPPDVVRGTHVDTFENDDIINVYANYDLVRAAVCDDLEVMLWRGDASCVELKYRLSPEEKEMLLPKMEEYCKQNTGMTLAAWREQYMMGRVSEQIIDGGETPSPAELAAQLLQQIKSKAPIMFKEAVRVRIEPDEWVNCRSFREYAAAMQYPDPTRVHIPEDTAKLLTLLVGCGAVTAWQANMLHSDYTFDDDGREALYWPEPAEALEKLGLPDLAAQFRENQTPAWEQRM